jgi:hypothetical protein
MRIILVGLGAKKLEAQAMRQTTVTVQWLRQHTVAGYRQKSRGRPENAAFLHLPGNPA